MRADLLIVHAEELATMAGGPRKGHDLANPVAIHDGALAISGELIVDVGTTAEVLRRFPLESSAQVVNATGRAVLPGFVDPHTHLCFAGDRADEFAMRLQGATYQAIAAAGGGIISSVKSTRAASQEQLVELGLGRLDALALNGTTTVEIKSGYGLTTEDEMKQLRAIREMARRHPLDIIPTFMGAHEIPVEFRNDREGYINLLCTEMLPQVISEHRRSMERAAEPFSLFCDIFTENGVFTVEESRRILLCAKQLGFGLKVHADELSDLGGAEMAALVGATSADHLLFASETSLAAMSHAGTAAVCLPGTTFCLMTLPYANARRMIELGCVVALATDFNPGSCPTYSMPFIMALACMHLKLSPSEALAAATINAAAAIGLHERVGSLEVGKQADIVMLNAPSHRHIPYRMGLNVVSSVIKRGRLLVDKGQMVGRAS